MQTKSTVKAKSLVPYLNGVPDFTSGWNGENDVGLAGGSEDFGMFHAAYFIWGGRVWLQGTVYWVAPFEEDPVDALLGVLPPEIRPATTVEMTLLEDWPNSTTGIFNVAGSGNTIAQVTPDGTWTITGFLAPQDENPAYILDGINWPLPGLAIQNPEATEDARLDLAPYIANPSPDQWVPGPNGAFLVQGGGRIRGEGSVIALSTGAETIFTALPEEWRCHTRVPVADDPPEMVNDGTQFTSQELFPFNGFTFLYNARKQQLPTISGGPEQLFLGHFNTPFPFSSTPSGWLLCDNSPYFGTPSFGFPFAGTELSLERLSWIGGAGGASLIPGAAEAAESLGGAVRNAIRAIGRDWF